MGGAASASTLLSTADGLSGWWDGAAEQVFEIAPHGLGPTTEGEMAVFSRLDGRHRGLVLEHEIFGMLAAARLAPGRSGAQAEVRAAQADGPRTIFTLAAPTAGTFRDQLPLVRAYADLRAERLAEITEQIGDVLSYFGQTAHMHPSRAPWTLALLDAIQAAVSRTQQAVKHHLFCPRPIDMARQVMPVIQTPVHSTFPSGHAGESFALATAIEFLTGAATLSETPGPADLHGLIRGMTQSRAMQVAMRIAENRVVAGVHFPIDNLGGGALGIATAAALVWSMAQPEPDPDASGPAPARMPALHIDADLWGGDDVDLERLQSALTEGWEAADAPGAARWLHADAQMVTIPPASPLLRALWRRASAEWSPVIGTRAP